MSRSYFYIQLMIGNKKYQDKIFTDDCMDVGDLKKKVEKSTQLPTGNQVIRLYQSDDTSELNVDDKISDIFINSKMTLICKLETPPLLQIDPAKKPPVSIQRHKDYKHSKAIHSSRSYLTGIAEGVAKIYPITPRKYKGKTYITIGDIINEAYENNPEPRPEYRQAYSQRLNDFFTDYEWKAIEGLNNIVNPELHSALPLSSDGFMEIVLPVETSHLGLYYQQIACKSKIIQYPNHMIVKSEGSVSGGSTDSEKSA